MPKYGKVAIVGVGLIGGSIGLALKQRGLAKTVLGIGRRQETLDRALEVGAVDEVTTDLAGGLQDAQVAVVGTPVDLIVEKVRDVAELGKTLEFITDVGSTKAEICRQLDAILPAGGNCFVGSHPLAGDHRSGPENARAELFADRKVVVTPTAQTVPGVVESAIAFWEALGAGVQLMSPDEHDSTLAITSHLPHLVASALADCTPRSCLPLAATGWADTTRIAAGDSHLWTQIFSHNAHALVEQIDRLVEALLKARGNMADADWASLQDFLERAKQTRDALGN